MFKHSLVLFVLIIAIAFSGCGSNSGSIDSTINLTPTAIINPTPTSGAGNSHTFGAKYIDQSTVSNYPQAINPSSGQSLPSSINLTSLMPPVGNQGQLASCVGWAAGYAMRTGLAQKSWNWGTSDTSHQASPSFLYGMLLKEMGLPWGSGTDLQVAHDILVKTGCNSLASTPYSDTVQPNLTIKDANVFKIDSYKSVDTQNRTAIKTELANNNIVDFGANIYNDFEYYTGGVYKGSGVYLTQGNQNAAHAMTLAGYDDSKGAYLIMNSWGKNWGENGYMWMDYNTFEKTAFVAFVADSSVTEPPVPSTTPSSEPTVSPDGKPTGWLGNGFQFYDSFSRRYYIYVEWSFDRSVLLKTITAKSPDGLQGEQRYGFWYKKGYVYFYRVDGYEFVSGNYSFTFDINDINGNNWQLTGQTYIDSMNGYAGTVDVRGRKINVTLDRNVKSKAFTEGSLYGMNNKPCVVKK
jgi:hypothetical protein